MVVCDSPDCNMGGLIFSCVGLTSAPTDAWFCPNCRHTHQFSPVYSKIIITLSIKKCLLIKL